MVFQRSQNILDFSSQLRHLRVISDADKEERQESYASFAELLVTLRRRSGMTQPKFAAALAPYFCQANVQELNYKSYGNLERDDRYLFYDELFPLFIGLVQICGLVPTSNTCAIYLNLARQKIERSARVSSQITPTQWQILEQHLLDLQEYVAPERESVVVRTKHLKEIQQVKEEKAHRLALLETDTRHILGRETWLAQMCSYLHGNLHKKLIIIQAVMGTGKTSGLTLLHKRLLKDDTNCHIIQHSFKAALKKTPAEHLDILLAHILHDLMPQLAERLEAPSLKEHIKMMLEAIHHTDSRLILLVDDAEVCLEQNGELSASWQQFLEAFVKEEHHAVLYMAMREWPGWHERDNAFVVQTEMEPLLPEAGIQLWKNLGFLNEQENVLQKATELCGGNPHMIEIVAQMVQKPILPYNNGWSKEPPATRSLQGLSRFVADPHYLSKSMIDAYPMLDEVITTRLSPNTRNLLILLAVSPTPLPPPLLEKLISHHKRCVKELTHTSLLAYDSERLRLNPLVAESVLQQLSQEEREQVEKQLISAYEYWIDEGDYLHEQEQATVIAELIILYLGHHQFLEAAGLVIHHTWLLYALGHARRIARITDTSVRSLRWLSETNEIGSLLLRLRLIRFFRKDWTDQQREQAYLQLYEIMCQKRISFKPKVILYIIHHRLRYLVEQKQYVEAHALVTEEYSRYADLQKSDPITYIELLDRKAYVAGRWGDYLAAQGEQEQVYPLRREAVDTHLQCVEQMRRYEYFAPPLLRSHILYQKAKILHDLSFYEKMIGDEEKAMAHITESLTLKQAGYSSQGSLAVTYDDYAYFLARQGNYQQALAYSDLALQLTQRMVDAQLNASKSQMGMLLVNRGKLLLQLKRFDEAQQCFETGKSLVEGTARHHLSFPAAEQGLRVLEEQRRSNPHGYLDQQWFTRYSLLASYSDVRWLTPIGPLTDQEQQEWNETIKSKEESAKQRITDLIVQTQERELAASFQEQRNPHLQYPLVPLADIEEKILGFQDLRAAIERDETNSIVCRLYLDAIDERINELGMIAAAGRQDDQSFWLHSRRLYTLPTLGEMELAIAPLAEWLRKGLSHSSTSDLASRILRQTKQWAIDPMSLPTQDFEQKLEASAVFPKRISFSSEAVQRFFERVFGEYQFDWSVLQDTTVNNPRVSLHEKQLILPKSASMNSAKIREILAHEIEIHAFRSAAGEKSRLQLLSLGLANFLETEEGLATYYAVEAAQFGATKPSKTWIGTLAIGLAAGILDHPLSFHQLRSLLIDVFSLRDMLAHKKTAHEIREDALKNAHKRCLRTWRGVSHLDNAGICATKDHVYLRGYLRVGEALQHDQTTFERLLVGSAGLEHLEMLRELDIVRPHAQHLKLACFPDLEVYINREE